MTEKQVLNRLDGTGIRREQDLAVPINGHQIKLPYMVVRTERNIEGSDNGRVQFLRIDWTVALFTVNKDKALENKISGALGGVGAIVITNYPDGTPYQTNFEFTTRETMK